MTPYFLASMITCAHIVLIHQCTSHAVFQVFPLPDPSLPSTTPDEVLQQTHFGVCPMGLTEPAFLSSSFSNSTSPSTETQISFAAIALLLPNPAQLQVYQLVLNDDSSITFSTPYIPTTLVNPFNLNITVCERSRGQARGISMPGRVSPCLVRYSIAYPTTFPPTALTQDS